MMIRTRPASPRGFSLIELIIAIMIIGTAVVGVMSMLSFITERSADPMMQEQALMTGEAYMEEILLQPFLDPSVGTTQVCPAPEGGRSDYDNVCDYNGLVDVGARDQFGTPIADLAAYTVSVTVTGDDTVVLGPVTGQITNIPVEGVVQVLRVDVRVKGPGLTAIMLTGYRTNFVCNAPLGSGSAFYCLPL